MCLLLPYMKTTDAKRKLFSIIRCFEFVNHGNYSYYRLFEINTGWYPYFEVNAWPDGRCRDGDDRPGVDGEQVNRVMRLYKGGDLELKIDYLSEADSKVLADFIVQMAEDPLRASW